MSARLPLSLFRQDVPFSRSLCDLCVKPFPPSLRLPRTPRALQKRERYGKLWRVAEDNSMKKIFVFLIFTLVCAVAASRAQSPPPPAEQITVIRAATVIDG